MNVPAHNHFKRPNRQAKENDRAVTTGTDSNLCKCGRPFSAHTDLCLCGQPCLDHTINEGIACGICKMDPPPSYEPELNLVCASCGKKRKAHTFNELMSTSENHHTYRNAI